MTEHKAPSLIQSLPDSEGNVLRYRNLGLLGKGGFAHCFKVEDMATGSIYAAKTFDKAKMTPILVEKLKTEIEIHRRLHHKHIVKFVGYFKDAHFYYLLLDLCQYSSMETLLQRRGRLKEYEGQYYMLQILEGVHYMHSRLVIHRDLKLGNVFLHNGLTVKIGDFGLAIRLNNSQERRTSFCGTPNYLAPEVLNRQGSGHSFGADIWSMGIILYTMLIGRPPFASSSLESVYEKIKNNRYVFPADVDISMEAKDLIWNMLQLDPDKRMTIDQIKRHSFFRTTPPPRCLPLYALDHTPLKPKSSSKSVGPLVPQSENNENSSNVANKAAVAVHLDPYCINFLDFSSKYGVAYSMSNSQQGVLFNDNSSMLFYPNSHSVVYVDPAGVIVKDHFSALSSMSHDMEKKIKLCDYFARKLGVSQIPRQHGKEQIVFIARWVLNDGDVALYLSNKTSQVQFQDGTRVLLSHDMNSAVILDGNNIGMKRTNLRSPESVHVIGEKRVVKIKHLLRLMNDPNNFSRK